MSKIGESLLKGATEALEHARGKKTTTMIHKVVISKHIDVKAIRLKLHLTRQEFSDMYGFSIRTLEKWEQGIRVPDGAARAYLVVIDRNHKAVESALSK